ncbi:MAG: type II toxin-antitoxin system RelE/ParE family toxin [Syntrophobacteraceae bacterium]|nr:type II toxin-antitoxin system RelE/ParE family toxin [Syntrophobacteraceae bacterium]
MRRVEFHPEAYREAEEARSWYEKNLPGLGMAFIDEVQMAVNSIIDNPDMWPPFGYGTRRFFLRRFPFSVVYRHDATKIQIVAVAHQRRRPGYWKER